MVPDNERALKRSAANWRAATIVVSLLLAATVGYAFYAIMDQGVTLAYRDAELERVQASQAFLERIVLRVTPASTRSHVLSIVREGDSLAFEKDGAVYAGGVGFYFDGAGRLACITAGYPAEQTHCAAFARADQ